MMSRELDSAEAVHHSPRFFIQSTYISVASFHITTLLNFKHTTVMAQPPDYNEVVKERQEFQRDVNTAGVGYSGAPAGKSRSFPKHTRLSSQTVTPHLSQSPYPADKSARPQGSQTASYGQPSTPGMGYGATQNPYISQQPQPISQPMHYYRTPAGKSLRRTLGGR